MSTRELDEAGITDPKLRASYERCRELNAAHGKTYYLATLLLPGGKRPFVHALYGFARYADEIVDDLGSSLSVSEKSAALTRLGEEFFADVARGESDHPVAAAVVDTVMRWNIPTAHFEAFLHSMRMDLTVGHYDTFDDLYEYVYGSAAVIGLQMVPILEPASDSANARAIDLGIAFQLANFIRDVDEDLDRGRIYLPLSELAEFGVTPEVLAARRATPAVKAALAFQVARVRELEERSRAGIADLHPAVQPCIEAARILYCGIVDAVEAIDYEVFDQRATVGMRRRLEVALPAWRAARVARRRFGPGRIRGV
ncbi:MAG: phytoene/squalene synthase family protein [Actinobacteria bacterium]|nr:phytoene/squalene synthase family protein [Actinomycetota bacterium]MCB9412279.1 phytoene/squalene synthase family protein [Actinomycetota bacterium]